MLKNIYDQYYLDLIDKAYQNIFIQPKITNEKVIHIEEFFIWICKNAISKRVVTNPNEKTSSGSINLS